jgi:hypothetical protein
MSMPMVTSVAAGGNDLFIFSSPLLVMRGVGPPSIRSGLQEKKGAIKL